MSTTVKHTGEGAGEGTERHEPRVIKRYSNRKLYDTERSCYVTLEEIGKMVRDNVEVKIVDNRSKEDLTAVTLTQILYAEEKKQRSLLPLGALKDIIQSSGEQVAEFVQQKIAQPVSHIREAAQQRVGGIFKRGDKTVEPENLGSEEAAREARPTMREWIDSRLEESQRRLDDRVRAAFDNLTHIPALREEIAELRRRLDRIEEKLGIASPTPSP